METQQYPYQSVANKELMYIFSGIYSEGGKMPSVRAIAKKYQVSVFTATKAINHLREMGYVEIKSRSAAYVHSNYLSKYKGAINAGILIAGETDTVNPESNLGRSIAAMKAAFDIERLIFTLHSAYWYARKDTTVHYVSADSFNDAGLDILVPAGIYDPHYLSDLARLQIPILALDVDASASGIDSVFFDNRAAAFDLTRCLIERGHHGILCVTGPGPIRYAPIARAHDPAAEEREDGFALAMRTFAPGQPLRNVRALISREGSKFQDAFETAMAGHPEITAVVSESALDLSTHPGVEQACFCSDEVPENAALSAVCDFEQLGRSAASVIEKRLARLAVPVLREAVLPLIRMRESAEAASGNRKSAAGQSRAD